MVCGDGRSYTRALGILVLGVDHATRRGTSVVL